MNSLPELYISKHLTEVEIECDNVSGGRSDVEMAFIIKTLLTRRQSDQHLADAGQCLSGRHSWPISTNNRDRPANQYR